ncbi:T-complex protein 1 subunit theta-like isoform X2 [Porites lutea]|uniref:T-complex protein 1 subunit theta-like isoform X2 n=1 Tax=Porites lutea TaxID=51062 RepID=UPI003CC501F7
MKAEICFLIIECEDTAASTVVIRGSTENIMDDIERAVDDGVNTFKAVTRDDRFVPGAGATEIELAKQISSFGETCAGLEQYAIDKFTESLEVVPRTLEENAGVKPTELIPKLKPAHQGGDKNAGFDNEEDLIQAMSQMICYNVTLRLGRNLRKE